MVSGRIFRPSLEGSKMTSSVFSASFVCSTCNSHPNPVSSQPGTTNSQPGRGRLAPFGGSGGLGICSPPARDWLSPW
eukprot:1176855-Prorocentrum_minimum.AAC.1